MPAEHEEEEEGEIRTGKFELGNTNCEIRLGGTDEEEETGGRDWEGEEEEEEEEEEAEASSTHKQ